MKKIESLSITKRLIMFTTLAIIMSLFFGFSAFAAESLPAPTGLKQTSAQSNLINIKWDAVLGADGYLVEMSTDNNKFTEISHCYSPETTVTGLSSGTTYYIRVTAFTGTYSDKKLGNASSSIVVYTRTSLIFTNKVYSVTNVTNDTISLSWSAVPGATKYKIYKNVNNAFVLCDETASTSYNATNLTAATDYSFKITAVGISGLYVDETTDYYSISAKTTPVILTEPIAVWSAQTNIIAFYVQNPTTNIYQVEVYSEKGKYLTTINSTTTLFTYKTNAKNKNLIFRIRGGVNVNDKMYYGNWSSKYYIVYPVVVRAKKTSSTTNKLTWHKISLAKSYTVFRFTKITLPYQYIKLGTTKKTSFIAKKLKKNKKYYYYVAANVKVKGKLWNNYPSTFYFAY